MDKLKMQTPNLADGNFAALVKMFPNAVTETADENGEVVRAIDADVLAQEINTRVVSGKEERYQFTWPDKKKSVLLANAPIAAALRPCREDESAVMKDGDTEITYTRTGSVDFDTTENLYIEGDNLDVLKLLRETYLNRVKMIYIDPPYNTGKDFIYEDDFAEETGEFLRRDGQYDEQGNRLTPNLDSNGRFHTDWLNMIYPRLRVARDLLTDDGIIFISIDDNEIENLKKICNEVFGSVNFVAQLNIITGANQAGEGVYVQKNVEYCLIYAKNILSLKMYRVDKVAETYRNLNDAPSPLSTRPDMGYTIYFNPVTKDIIPEKDYDKERIHLNKVELVYSDNQQLMKNGYIPIRPGIRNGYLHRWRWGMDTFLERIDEVVILGKDGVYSANFVQSGLNPPKNYQNFSAGTSEIKALFDGKAVFDYPKGTAFVKYILSISTSDGDIILDFFSGSATTAHAVMQLNAEDDGKRKFIMVQLPEATDEKSEAYKAGYKNICEIGKERIRRAGKKIKEDNKGKPGIENLDIGFRDLKLDSSNMKDVYYTPEEYAQISFNLDGFMDNIKEDRTDEDLLFQVMLDLGIPLSAKIKQDGKIFYVNDNYLIACFGKVDTALITEIAKKKPYYAVFRDSSFLSDSALVNFEQVFNTYSPKTIRRVL